MEKFVCKECGGVDGCSHEIEYLSSKLKKCKEDFNRAFSENCNLSKRILKSEKEKKINNEFMAIKKVEVGYVLNVRTSESSKEIVCKNTEEVLNIVSLYFDNCGNLNEVDNLPEPKPPGFFGKNIDAMPVEYIINENIRAHEAFYRRYSIELHWVDEEDGQGYWFAYHPEFGHSICSATGKTIGEAIDFLSLVADDVIEYYLENGKELPDVYDNPLLIKPNIMNAIEDLANTMENFMLKLAESGLLTEESEEDGKDGRRE